MNSYPGFPIYVERAAAGRPVADRVAVHARRQPALSSLSSLVGQAYEAEPAHRVAIMAHAAEFAEALDIASGAARLIVDEARAAFGIAASCPPIPADTVLAALFPDPSAIESSRRGRKDR